MSADSKYLREIDGVKISMWCMNATRLVQVRLPTPLLPTKSKEPPGCDNILSIFASLCNICGQKNILQDSHIFQSTETSESEEKLGS